MPAMLAPWEAPSEESLTIRHDHGSAYMSGHVHRELTFLGMTISPSFVRKPEYNGGRNASPAR